MSLRSSGRARTRSWSYSNTNVPSTPSSPVNSVVRSGPIFVGLAFLLLIPVIFFGFTYDFSNRSEEGPWSPITLQRWKNPDYTVTKKQTIFELPDRRCDAHTVQEDNNNPEAGSTIHILLEEPHQVMVVVYDGDDRWYVQSQRAYAIPGSQFRTPLSQRFLPKQAPVVVAQQLVQQTLGISVPVTKEDTTVKLDKYNIVDGSIMEDDPHWTFLGRFRNMADSGGGFMYGYLLKVDNLPASVDSTMTTKDLKTAYMNGLFSETKGTATIGLALHHVAG